ncbi:MAG: hypothetical protein HYY03_09180 [Chloroflexi bacterium]|nr:hypothetical protein [Chloroflexota bacterium]
MSKLADLIRKASRVEAAPMGFGARAARKPAPAILCLVRLSAGDAHKAAEAAGKGADAVLLEGVDPGKLKEQAQKAGAVVLGVHLLKPDRAAVNALREAGADFVVLDPQAAPAESLLEEGIGVVLTLARDTADTTLRLLADLSLDALLVAPPEDPLTVARALELRRLSVLSRLPLLRELPSDVDSSRLQALRDAGVAGVIIEGRTLDRLPSLRRAVDALPPRGRRREERPQVMLPVQALVSAGEEEEEEFS